MSLRTRSTLITWMVLFLIPMAANLARAQDIGNLFRKAARDVVRRELSDESPPGQPSRATSQGEIFTVNTADGWTLVAHRFRPKTAVPKPGAAPIILCHGLSYNALFWTLDANCNFPDYLSKLGYDVWVVDLRGCGLSRKWVWKLDDAPNQIIGDALRRMSKGKLGSGGYATIDPKFADWSLDHHIFYDVPALVTLVKHHTKADEVTWVGHSMGGIIALAHLSRFKNPGIGKLVTIGSQFTMPEGRLMIEFASEMMAAREGQLTGKLVGRDVMNQGKTSVDNLFFNVKNTPPKVYEALSGWAKDIPAIALMRQYMTLSETGILWDSRRKFDYSKAAANIKVPILVTCGASDQFAPPESQKYLFDHVGSTDKTLVIFGKAQGFAVDSGHDDTLVGNTSREQVYPLIERWISGSR